MIQIFPFVKMFMLVKEKVLLLIYNLLRLPFRGCLENHYG